MKIAVTGGTGFLGEYVIKHLEHHGYTPIVLTRNQAIQSNDCEYITTDYSREDLISKLKNIDSLVHLAAKRSSQGLIRDFHDNEVLTQNLYEACKENRIQNIVFASTISVYSTQEEIPWSEKCLPSPELVYSVSKLANEYIGDLYSGKYNMRIKNLRLAHLFGFNEKNNYMINRFFREAFNGNTLTLNACSVARREFLYAKDAAKAISCALSKRETSGTFNVGSGEALTNLEVAENINSVFNNDGKLIIKDPDGDEGIKSSLMISEGARKTLDFKPDYTFTSAIKEIYHLMKELKDVPRFY